MKLAIIGAAGSIGAPTAFYTGLLGVVDEIKMIDPNTKAVKNHVLDMSQAVLARSNTKITVADYPDLGDCDIILLGAAKPQTQASSRDDWLAGNLQLLSKIQEDIAKYAHNKIIICATNPTDVFTYYLLKKLGWDKNKLMGFCINDSVRIAWGLSNVLGLEYSKFETLSIGEHGAHQVPLWSQVKYDGKPMEVALDVREKVVKAISDWTTEILAIADIRSSGWLSCVTLAQMVSDIVKGSKRPIPVTTFLDGEYGQKDICLGVPTLLGPNGVEKIVELDINADEKQQFNNAADKVRSLMKGAGL